MTKAELAAKLAESTGMTKKDADNAVSAVFDAITEELKGGGKVQLVGFGTFGTKARPARTCINPRTKEPVKVAACTVPFFKPGKGLKDVIK
ncbi:MAG: HU family DNA-binding protein [Oscillospiraceae bacterium]|nr:HU family DNA-binding protein [Oscillospiraceae bacterium]